MFQIKFCLDEWKTGTRSLRKEKFTEQQEKESFEGFLKDVTTWNELAPTVTLKIRENMYKRARYVVLRPLRFI